MNASRPRLSGWDSQRGQRPAMGRPGPVALRVQARFLDAVAGRLPEYAAWLTRVPAPVTVART